MKVKYITNTNDIEFISNIKEEDITKSFIMENFGFFDGKIKFNPYEYITIPKGKYGPEGNKNKNEFTTTVGLYIFNKHFIEKELFDLFGYINYPLTGKALNKLNEQMSYAILEDVITIDALKNYSQKVQHFMRNVSILSANYTDKMLEVSDYLAPFKKKLIKENKAELDAGNPVVAKKIEDQLLAKAAEYLKDDPSMEIYDSVSRGSWDNNFKALFVMKGAIMDPDPTKGFTIATSNYSTGISKDEYQAFGNSIPGGAYAKAHNTQLGGYWVKLFMAAYQHIVAGPPGSDCGSTKYITVTLDSSNINEYMYQYIVSGSQLIELTSSNRDAYLGKTVKMRFSSLCQSKDYICNKCLGNLYYRMDNLENVGMLTIKLPSRILNWSLKKFHDSTIKIAEIDVNKAFNS